MRTEQKIERGVRLNVKTAPGLDTEQLAKVLSKMPGIGSVIQTFPDETDAELSTLYILEADPSKLGVALEALRQSPYIEYVEETATRGLIW